MIARDFVLLVTSRCSEGQAYFIGALEHDFAHYIGRLFVKLNGSRIEVPGGTWGEGKMTELILSSH